MVDYIIEFSVKNKLIVFLFVLSLIALGLYSVTQIPVGAVPDVTNNQVQVITTSRNLSTEDVEQFITGTGKKAPNQKLLDKGHNAYQLIMDTLLDLAKKES